MARGSTFTLIRPQAPVGHVHTSGRPRSSSGLWDASLRTRHKLATASQCCESDTPSHLIPGGCDASQSSPSNLTSAAGFRCFICCRGGRTWRRQQEESQGTHRRQGDWRGTWPQGRYDESIWLYVSWGRRPWALGQGFPGMNKSALSPWELPESGPGRERPAGRQGLLDTALPGSSLLQTKMPICPKVYLIILGNLQCPQDYGWHGSSWGGQSPEWPLVGPAEVTGRTSPGSVSEAQCRVAGAGRCPLGRAEPVHTGLWWTVPKGRL